MVQGSPGRTIRITGPVVSATDRSSTYLEIEPDGGPELFALEQLVLLGNLVLIVLEQAISFAQPRRPPLRIRHTQYTMVLPICQPLIILN